MYLSKPGFISSAAIVAVFLVTSGCCVAGVCPRDGSHPKKDSAVLSETTQPADEIPSAPPDESTSDLARLWIAFLGDVEFLVRDPNGLRTGCDGITDTIYQEIPGGPYGTWGTGTLLCKDANLEKPIGGDYLLTVTQVSSGSYTFWTRCYDYSAPSSPFDVELDNIPADTGVIHTYIVNLGSIPRAPCSVTGGFAGSENEAKDTDRLLSYASVAKTETVLNPGTTKFSLVLIYGAMASPKTFAATLNNEDVGNLFSPADGGYEVVSVPLRSGENLLVLSIDGETVDGSVTDTDSLVFVVK